MDWGRLNREDLRGRRALVEVMIADSAVDSAGNITVAVCCGHGRPRDSGGVGLLSAMVHTSAFKEVFDAEIAVGDYVRWKPDGSGVLRTKGIVLWKDAKYVLIRWENFDEPEIAPLDAVEPARS